MHRTRVAVVVVAHVALQVACAAPPAPAPPAPPPGDGDVDEDVPPEPVDVSEIDATPFDVPQLELPFCSTPRIAFVGVDDTDGPPVFEPFDIIRLSAADNVGSDGAPFLGRAEWRMMSRPEGSSATPQPEDG